MKKKVKKQTSVWALIALLIAIAWFLCGCASVASHNTVSVPSEINLTVDQKPVAKYSSLVGQVFKVNKDVEAGNVRKIDLRQEGLDKIVNWTVIGGVLVAVAGVIVALVAKKWMLGASLLGSGLVVVVGTLAIKALIVPLVWAASIGLLAALAYEIFEHRKQLGIKKVVETAKDLADNGKIDGSIK